MDLRRKKRPTPIIPIVPLVDILVVLLMFFIATTTFKSKAAHHLQVSLPQSNALGTAVPRKEARKTLAITKDRKIFLDNNEVRPEALAAALKEMKTALPEVKLELQADQDTSLGLLVTVWDALKEAGWSINDVPARIQRAATQQMQDSR